MDADTERDIVERLREFAAMYADRQKLVTSELMASAADEITRLRAQPGPREVALRHELRRLSLVIESAVRTADPVNRPAIVSLLNENDAVLAALSQASDGREESR